MDAIKASNEGVKKYLLLTVAKSSCKELGILYSTNHNNMQLGNLFMGIINSAKFDQIVLKISHWAAYIAAYIILFLLLINFIDIIGSKLFNKPLMGIIELIGFSQIIIIPLGIALTQKTGHNIGMEVVYSRLSPRIQAILSSFSNLFVLSLFIVIIWQLIRLGISSFNSGEYTATLRISPYIFIFLMAVAFLPTCLVLISEFINWIERIR